MSLYAIGDLHLHFQSVLKAPGQPDLTFLQDSYEVYRDYALVATKGFTFEGPFYLDGRGHIVDWDEEAEQVIYAHCHGESRFYDSIHGEYRGRTYHLVSGDFLRWKPLKILNKHKNK